MTDAIVPQQPRGFSLVPRTMDEALRYSDLIAQSNFCPKEYRGRAGDVLVAVQYGLELGILPLQALQGIAVINGKPTIYGDLALAVVRGSGLLENFEESDPAEAAKAGKAICRAKRKGQASPIERTFSVQDAKGAGLWGKAGPWTQYPGRMLVMRARSWMLRDGFADALKGLQLREEVQDYHDVKADVTVLTTAVAPKAPTKAESTYRIVAEVPVEEDPSEAQPVNMEPGEPPTPPPDDDGMPTELRRILRLIDTAPSIKDLMGLGAEIASMTIEPSLLADARKAYATKLDELRKDTK